MSIFPLPQFEADMEAAREADRRAYEALKAPRTIVVRFGSMRMVGEYPYSGDAKPGCGSKIVVRTHRGVEIGEMLTSTCPNAGCSKSVTRQEMLSYIENSGGREYPFFTEGRALRVATVEDLQKQSGLDAQRPGLLKSARARVAELGLDMKVIEAEPILGCECLTFYFMAEQRVDFRELVRRLAEDHGARIELRQVGARDEARLRADYERCGQHCCCRQFLKVLKPVSMRSAKVQKSTLDPLKISGRCGRLMCCLRYEDETYETLRKRLPNRGKRVGTPGGVGVVVDTQILTQLVLVSLEEGGGQIAVPVEELIAPEDVPVKKAPPPDPLRGMSAERVEGRTGGAGRDRQRPRDDRAGSARTEQGRPPGGGRPNEAGRGAPEQGADRRRGREERQDAYRRRAQEETGRGPASPDMKGHGPRPDGAGAGGGSAPPGPGGRPPGEAGPAGPGQPQADKGEGGGPRKRRRRRGRRPPPGSGPGPSGRPPEGGSGPGGPPSGPGDGRDGSGD